MSKDATAFNSGEDHPFCAKLWNRQGIWNAHETWWKDW